MSLGPPPDFVGDLVATGGATSGEHVNVPVTAVNVFLALGVPGCPTVGPLIRAELPGRQCVAAPGDSGGPVYSYQGGEVIGRGTVTAGFRGSATCPGQFPDEGSNTVFYAPLLRPPGDPQVGSLQFGGVDILT